MAKMKVTKKTLPPKKKARKEAAPSIDADDIHHFSDNDGDVEMSNDENTVSQSDDQADSGSDTDEESEPEYFLVEPKLKRSARIVDPSNPAHAELIRQATLVGSEIYEEDVAQDLPGDPPNCSRPELYRNVKWGTAATSYDEFKQTEPFIDITPGRYELQPDGTVKDQKYKLVVKLYDLKGNRKIFRNPPPKDWNNQAALSALNKRIVQQWRRNTRYRFRKAVTPYLPEERAWILKTLNDRGKPASSWKSFVQDFNAKFEGQMLTGQDAPRPERTQSSLSKEISRFSVDYKAGKAPVTKTDQNTKPVAKAKRGIKRGAA